jgi:CBS domain-containing protein
VGTKINEVMTDRPRAVTPQTSVREAARLMEEEDVGSLPVVEEKSTGEVVQAISQQPGGPRVTARDTDDDSNVGLGRDSSPRSDQ